MGSDPKDRWDKADILLKPLGGLMTALAVALLGLMGRDFLESRQSQEADLRLYTELMSSRERSDSSLRKDMLDSIIATFLSDQKSETELEKRVLGLELLAYNFHDSLDLSPLFKHVAFQIDLARERERASRRDSDHRSPEGWPARVLRRRLQRVASDIVGKQLGALEVGGAVQDFTVTFGEVAAESAGVQVGGENGVILPVAAGTLPAGEELPVRQFFVTANEIADERHEIQFQLDVYSQDSAELSETFWVGHFDFPLIDNARLSSGDRAAIVLRNWQDESAELALVYFPASRASLKEKLYYDEVVEKLRSLREESF